jgi:hypothetical protein
MAVVLFVVATTAFNTAYRHAHEPSSTAWIVASAACGVASLAAAVLLLRWTRR